MIWWFVLSIIFFFPKYVSNLQWSMIFSFVYGFATFYCAAYQFTGLDLKWLDPLTEFRQSTVLSPIGSEYISATSPWSTDQTNDIAYWTQLLGFKFIGGTILAGSVNYW